MPLKVSNFMTSKVLTANQNDGIRQTFFRMRENEVRHMPVLDDDRKLVGIISDRDFSAFTGAAEDDVIDAVESARSSTVGNFMNTSPVKVDPETNIRDVVELMLLHRVGAVPVADLDTGDLLGIVSYVDLLRVLQETLEPGA